jgi:hypothetical protein
MLVAMLLTRGDVLVCPLLLVTAAATFRMKYLKTMVMQTLVETDPERHRIFFRPRFLENECVFPFFQIDNEADGIWKRHANDVDIYSTVKIGSI